MLHPRDSKGRCEAGALFNIREGSGLVLRRGWTGPKGAHKERGAVKTGGGRRSRGLLRCSSRPDSLWPGGGGRPTSAAGAGGLTPQGVAPCPPPPPVPGCSAFTAVAPRHLPPGAHKQRPLTPPRPSTSIAPMLAKEGDVAHRYIGKVLWPCLHSSMGEGWCPSTRYPSLGVSWNAYGGYPPKITCLRPPGQTQK